MWGFIICTELSHKCLICLYFLNKLGLLFFSLQNYQVLQYHGDGKKQRHRKRQILLFLTEMQIPCFTQEILVRMTTQTKSSQR